jgi:hypothetical protein
MDDDPERWTEPSWLAIAFLVIMSILLGYLLVWAKVV